MSSSRSAGPPLRPKSFGTNSNGSSAATSPTVYASSAGIEGQWDKATSGPTLSVFKTEFTRLAPTHSRSPDPMQGKYSLKEDSALSNASRQPSNC